MAAPFQRVLVADAETAWDSKEYTLSKMTTEEYIRDPRFKTWGFCFKWLGDPGKARWVGAPHLPEYLARIDWSTTAILAQNTMFDGAILNWRYGVKPCFYFDTLSMGRAVRGVERGNSLAKMAEDYGLPAKGRAVHSTDGMLDTLTHEIERELAEYCKHDVFLCEEIFKRLVMLERGECGQDYPLADMSAWKYPIKELRLIDMTLRMFVEPKIELDADMLTDALHEEKETREALLNRLNITDGILASTPQFAELLRSIGVEPPLKKNPKGEMIPALAKNDALFQAMLNGEDENLALLCEARMKVKSTTERTRAQRFLDISARGPLPVPLSYYGAHSGRWSACLIAETKVTVYDPTIGQCEKRIVDVLPDDLVWDGVEFVQHEGVKFSGYQEVIEHDGITGTPEHRVFIDDDTSVTLEEALSRGARVMDAAAPDDRALDAARARLKRVGR